MTAMPPEPSDPAIALLRAQTGDREAFRQIVLAHQARVFSIALRLTGRRAEAEELAQDVFVQLYGALTQIAGPDHLKHWLLRTVSHRAIDRLRQRGRQGQLVSLDTLHEAPEGHVPDGVGDPLAGAHLRQLIAQLAPDARAVLLLRFQEDLDPTEIARMLAMSLNTVKSHLRRSLDWLRERCDGEHHGS